MPDFFRQGGRAFGDGQAWLPEEVDSGLPAPVPCDQIDCMGGQPPGHGPAQVSEADESSLNE
ncbi:MAG: hypothetical protein LUQ44_02500 [Methanothrix sp.]|nr:hypothetical protein [Methanothrix sp.]